MDLGATVSNAATSVGEEVCLAPAYKTSKRSRDRRIAGQVVNRVFVVFGERRYDLTQTHQKGQGFAGLAGAEGIEDPPARGLGKMLEPLGGRAHLLRR